MGGRLTSLLFKQTPTHILFTLPQGGKKPSTDGGPGFLACWLRSLMLGPVGLGRQGKGWRGERLSGWHR